MSNQIIGLLNPTISLIFSAVFLALWLRARENRHILAFAIGNFGFAICMLTYHYAEDTNSWITITVVRLGLTTWALTYAWGACRRMGQTVPIRLFLFFAVIALVMVLMTIPTNDENARLYATNGFTGLVMAIAAHNLYKAAPRDFIDRAIISLFILVAVQSYTRPIVVMIARGASPDELYRESVFYTLFIVAVTVLIVLNGLALLAAAVVDQLRKAQQESGVDSLTGLRMRSNFEEEAVETLAHASGRNVPVAMIVADIDHFKQVNDIWGHQAGDAAIAAFGKLIESTVRSVDLCGRIGGEEFCVLVQDCHESEARKMAERVRKAFARMKHEQLGSEIRLTASFGVSCWREGEGYGRLFARADAALYSAKESGRNCVVSESDEAYTVKRDRRTGDRRGGLAMRAAG